ncbi:MAG: carboxymuconolactone decarboxylase family protein, partial [Dehalococcoidia bacterium]|nr:carboxymuconolactone decarboxylase family protein [Dehalococcoidia bacterium]
DAVARLTGVSDEQIKAIPNWEQSPCFNDIERAILQYTDEVIKGTGIADETFRTLQKYLNEREIVELTCSVGYWEMVAKILVALNIEIDEHPVNSLRDLQGNQRK